MVFESWETMCHVLHDPFSAFMDTLLSRFFMVSNLIFLYTMNIAGILTNLAFLMSAGPSSQNLSMEFRTICAEMDNICQQGIVAIGSVTSSLQDFQKVMSKLVQQGNQTVAALSAMF